MTLSAVLVCSHSSVTLVSWSPSTISKSSSDWFMKVVTDSSGSSLSQKQWAAEIIHLLLMRVPPQKWPLEFRNETCHGQELGTASKPPTILLKLFPLWLGSKIGETILFIVLTVVLLMKCFLLELKNFYQFLLGLKSRTLRNLGSSPTKNVWFHTPEEIWRREQCR